MPIGIWIYTKQNLGHLRVLWISRTSSLILPALRHLTVVVDHLSWNDQEHSLTNFDQSWLILTNSLTNFDQDFVYSCSVPYNHFSFWVSMKIQVKFQVNIQMNIHLNIHMNIHLKMALQSFRNYLKEHMKMIKSRGNSHSQKKNCYMDVDPQHPLSYWCSPTWLGLWGALKIIEQTYQSTDIWLGVLKYVALAPVHQFCQTLLSFTILLYLFTRFSILARTKPARQAGTRDSLHKIWYRVVNSPRQIIML